MPAVVCFTTAVHTKCEGMLNSDEIGKGSDKDSDKSFSYLMTAQSVKTSEAPSKACRSFEFLK